jgi:hypothetical protein
MEALRFNTTASNNTAVGYQAGYTNTTGTWLTAIGYQAGYTSNANNNTMVGYQAGKFTTGAGTTAVGNAALQANSTGANNTAVGDNTLASNTTGSSNAAVGGGVAGSLTGALGSNTTGSFNTALGTSALYSNTTATNNTAVGYQAGYTNVFSGYNVFLGQQAGYTHNLASIGNGLNTYVGNAAGYSATTGTLNSFLGSGSGYYITTGAKNTIIGGYSGNQGGLDIRTTSNNIVLSDGDGNPTGYFDSSGYFYLGINNRGIRIPSTGGITYINAVTSNSQFQLSYNSGSAGVSLASGATSFGTFSDERLKTVTGTYTNALADIAQIQPVKFTWKSDEENKPQVGVLAQSVQNVVPEAIDKATHSLKDDTEYLQVRYTELIPLMIASIQELKAEFDAYKSTHP